VSGESRKTPKFVDSVRVHTQKFLDELSGDNDRLRQKVEVLSCDNRLLEERLANLEEELRREREQRNKLLETIESIEALRVDSAEEYAAVEEENNNLANLYSATYSLHGRLDRDAILGVIKEIVINLIGSEEIGIFERVEGRPELRLIASMGLDEAECASLPLDSGIIGYSARNQKIYPRDFEQEIPALAHETNLTACVPLVVAGETQGAIAVFDLLPQKTGVSSLDYELFDMLACQASFALHCANLHALHARRAHGNGGS